MDITFSDSDIIEKNEAILIHLFFHLFDFDFRSGFFSNESSIYDMGSCGFTDKDYIELAQLYYDTCPANYTYSQGQNFYFTLSNKRFDKMIAEKFKKTYGFTFDKKMHYLKDFVLLLKEHFPERNWEKDNIFILKTLDNRIERTEKEIQEKTHQQDEKIVQLPVRKKLSPEEIRNGYNEFLMVKELKMSWEEARNLAQLNFDKKHEGKKFEPYIPEKKTNKMKP